MSNFWGAYHNWYLVDEFSGYLMTNNNYLPKNVIAKKVITFDEFIKCY